jgi:hypothetical protein
MSLLDRRKIAPVLGHGGWLVAALSAAIFFQFALNRGGVETAIWAAGLFLILQASVGSFSLHRLSRREWLFLGGTACVLLLSWAFSPDVTDTARSGRIVKFAILALAVQHVAQQSHGKHLRSWVAALTVTIVLWQFSVRHFTGSPYGTFANPHYLAYFSALLLPLLLFAATWFDRPYRYAMYLIVLLDLDLVFNDLVKPTIPLLALGAGLGVYGWTVSNRRVRRLVTLSLPLLLLALVLLIDETQIARLGLATPSGDERVRLWADSLRMLRDNDALDWLVGNGIGSFRNEYLAYFPPEYRDLTLPHNHVLELLYENGMIVTAMIIGFLASLGWRSLRLADSLADADLRRLARCSVTTLTIWFTFSFLAFGFYSRYTLYPLGFLAGVSFFLDRQGGPASRSSPLFPAKQNR